LDEYLQAARIDLHQDRVSIDLALTPGAELAAAIIVAIDGNSDGVTSVDEQHVYAEEVVRALEITVDGAVLPLRPTSSTFSTPAQFRRGEGTIRLRLVATHRPLSIGHHRLFFRNRHLAGESVYLANALVPESRSMSVTGQRRAADQSHVTIDYSVGPALAGFASNGILLGLVAAVLIARYTRRHGIR
jgi:hypothetical protein